MTPDEFADLVGMPLETVQRYCSLGLLDPEHDGLLDDVDLIRVRVVHRYVEHGGFEPETSPLPSAKDASRRPTADNCSTLRRRSTPTKQLRKPVSNPMSSGSWRPRSGFSR